MRRAISKVLAVCWLISLVLILGSWVALAASPDTFVDPRLGRVPEKPVSSAPNSEDSNSDWNGGGKYPPLGLHNAGGWLALVSLLALLVTSRAKPSKPRIDWPKVKAYARGFVKGTGMAALLIGAVVAAAALLGLATVELLAVACFFLVVGFGSSFLRRKQEQEDADIYPSTWTTIGVAVLDALGLSGVIEGITGRRMLTREPLDPETAGAALGTGLVQTVALGVGLRTFWKGSGHGLAGVRYADVMNKLPVPLRNLVQRAVELEWLTLSYDGSPKGPLLHGPAGRLVFSKVHEALIAANVRRLQNAFNNVKGGYGQLEARKYIEGDDDFKRFIADFRDPSARGLDAVIEMKDGTYQIPEVKMYSSRVGPNQIHRALKYTPGEKGQPSTVEINVDMLKADIRTQLKNQWADRDHVIEALDRKDGSVALRIELIDCEPTEALAKLDGQVINGVKILIYKRP